MKRRKSFRMMRHKIEGSFCVGRVILGATGLKRDAIFGQRPWVDWKDHEEIVLLQRVDDWPLGQFKRHCDGAAKALVQCHRPFVNAGNIMGNAVEFTLIGACSLKTNVMLGIAPVNTNISRE